MPLQKRPMSWPTGSLTPKLSATAAGNKSVASSKPKSPSSPATAPSSKKASATVADGSKRGASPSYCATSRAAPTSPATKGSPVVGVEATLVSAELLSRERVMLPPQHADKLLYNPDRCSCGLEWHCIPHDACFIHDSCLCE